jgi:ectoine hydroxylase-related dioxygenase (phytanoyl-CoA dioxygenase family)
MMENEPVKFMSEAQILERKQGFLETPSFEEIERCRQSQGRLLKAQLRKESAANNEKHLAYIPKADTDGFGAVILDKGVVRVNSVISGATVKEARDYVNRLLVDTCAAVENGIFRHEDLFGHVHSKTNRWDLLLPVEESESVMKCLSEVLRKDAPVATAIESVLGKDAELFELATMISDPGAPAQPLHPDSLYQNTTHPILTCFIALQDINSEMGPTLFIPGSATQRHHEDLQNRHLDPEAKGLVATAYNELATLGSGDCSLYSSMTLHCGSANVSENRRCLLYFSFRNNHVYRDNCRSGASIRSEIKERKLTLSVLQDLIKSW